MGFFSRRITLSPAEIAARQAADAARLLALGPAQPDVPPPVSEGSLKTEGTTTTFGQAIIVNPIIPDVLGSTPGVDIVAGAGFDVFEPGVTGVQGTLADGVAISAGVVTVAGGAFPTTTDTGVTGVQGTLADGVAISAGVVTVAGGAFPTTTDTGVTEVQGTLADGVATDILLKDSMDKAQGIVQVSANDPVLKAFLLEAKRADLMIALKSQMSPDLEFNTLQVPEPDTKFAYQRWLDDETNLVSQEDPAKDPLLTEKLNHVPRYIELQWTMIGVTEQTTENKVIVNPEIQTLKNAALLEPRGIGNSSGDTTQSVDKSLKTLNTFKSDTVKGKIVDIHDPLAAFAAISNKHEFGNSILTTIKFKSSTTIGSRSIFDLIRPK